MHGHDKGEHHKEQYEKWKQAFTDENMPAEERIKILEEKKEFLTQKLQKLDALIAELKSK